MIGPKKSIEDFTLSSLTLTELNRVLIRIGDLLSQAHGIGQAHDMHGSRIVNVGSPAQTGDAINKGALDAGLEPKTEGPDSSTDNAVVRWDGDDGRKLQNSLATVDDAGSVNIPAGQTYKIGGDPHTHAFDDLSDVDFTGEAWGDIVFRGEIKWNNLAAGEDGQVFTTHGPDAPPTWENLPDVGWQQDTDEWIYGSALYNYFYIANKDVTDKFPPGTKIKLTQTTEKFWYVDYSAVGELGHTSVVLVANSDYTLVDAPITNPCYSYDINPEGFPWDFTDDVATAIHVVDNKATPVDSDELGLGDSADSYGLKKTYWSDIKGTLKTYFDTLYTVDLATLIHGATEKPSLADNDEFPMTDSADTYALKKMLASDLKAALKTYFDTMYLTSLEASWPVGSIFLSVVATSPRILLGFGTWSRIAEGKFLVGQEAADEDFDTAEKTGGEKTHTLTSAEMPEHTHVQNPHQHDLSSLEKRSTIGTATTWDIFADVDGSSTSFDPGTYLIPAATATNQNTGGGAAHNNLPPYTVVYAWKRLSPYWPSGYWPSGYWPEGYWPN